MIGFKVGALLGATFPARLGLAALVAFATMTGALPYEQASGAPAIERVQPSHARLRAAAHLPAVPRTQGQGQPVTSPQAIVRLVDADTHEATPQGDATLAGALVTATPAGAGEALRFETGTDGTCALTGLAPGSWTLSLAEPPQGYADEAWTATIEVADDLSASVADLTCETHVLRSLILAAKVDADTGAASPQGDATLAGARLKATNRSSHPIVVDGATYAPGSVVATFESTSDGEARTASPLPFGTYELAEEAAPDGYRINDDWAQVVEVRRGSVVDDATGSGKRRPKGYVTVAGACALADAVRRGGVRVAKVDAAAGSSQGAATLGGAAFEVTYAGTSPIVVKGVPHTTGDVVATLTTDQAGIAETASDLLPFGTYRIRESKAPRGYLTDEAWARTFEVREDRVLVDLTGPEARCADSVIRGDLTLAKVSAGGDAPLARVAFLMRSKTTGEAHVLVTDDQGRLTTCSRERRHSDRTNASDAALKPDGSLDEAALDPTSGIWFAGAPTAGAPTDDARGALPYDSYDLVELASSANAGHKLRTLELTIDHDGQVADLGTVVDALAERVSTRLTLQQAGLVEGDDGRLVRLTDDVELNHLIRGRTYTLTGTLHVRSPKGDDLGPLVVGGKEVTASTTFTATDARTRASVQFSFARDGLAGTTLVCFESLSSEPDGVCATHADIADEDQTVRIPGIATELLDAHGCHEAQAAGTITLTDTVSFEALTPGATYLLAATLADRATGRPLTDAQGKEVAATQAFTATAESGSQEVTLTLDATDLAGRTVVCLERLMRDGVVVANHADLADAAQSVSFPAATTAATVAGTTVRTAPARADVMVTDAVTLANLTIGETYVVTPALYDRDTDQPVELTSAGARLTAEATTAQVEVALSFDAQALAGHTVVVFETVARERDGVIVATHAEPGDERQAIRVCGIQTLATDSATGAHVAAPAPLTIRDVVTYRRVTPGERLTVSGTLHDRMTGEPVRDGAGIPVASQLSFTPEHGSGTVELAFDLDATALAGHALVCFERLYDRDGNLVAEHADLADEDQTVHIARIATEATVSGLHLAQARGDLVVDDAVTLEGLVPGLAYELSSELHLRRDGVDEGVLATARQTLTPESDHLLATVELACDATQLAGADLVCYEYLTLDGQELCRHADLADEAQAIHVPRIHTEAGVQGRHEACAAPDTTIVDEVAYENLIPGLCYELTGRLVDRADGQEAKGPDGTPLTATVALTPEAATGTALVTFDLDATALAGHTLVCFETVTLAGTPVATHADLADEAQSVHIPRIQTTLEAAGAKVALAGADLILTDVVSFENLVPGREHTVRGSLHHADGTPVTGADGAPVTAEATFVPTQACGTTTVTFELDGRPLAGEDVVAYEELVLDGILVATHADNDDAAQTVSLPQVTTEATVAGTGEHELRPTGAPLVVEDRLSYRRLPVGLSYEVAGTLADAATGEPVTIDDAPVTATATLSPKTPDGVVTLTFEIADDTAVAGRTLVCLERVFLDGNLVAEHADLADEAQTIRVTEPETIEIDTTLHVRGSTAHEVAAAQTVTLTDTVRLRGLTTGVTYELAGTLMDAATSAPALVGQDVRQGADATPVWVEDERSYHLDLSCPHIQDLKALRKTTRGTAEAAGRTLCPHEGAAAGVGRIAQSLTFTAAASEATLDVDFTFDARGLAGATLVAFEELRCDGATLARHADLADADQTVSVLTTTPTPSTSRGSEGAGGSTTSRGGTLAQTGRSARPLLVCGVGLMAALTGTLSLIWRRRHPKDRDDA